MIIGKFPLSMEDVQQIEMPEGAEILTVQLQRGTPCIWALIDTDKPKQLVEIEMFGTGHPMDDKLRKYIGSFQMKEEQFIFHVFECE